MNIYLQKLLTAGIVRSPPGEQSGANNGGGAGDPPPAGEDDGEDDEPPVDATDPKAIEKLRRRMSGYRLKHKESEAKLAAQLASEATAREKAIKDAVKGVEAAANERVVRTEFRAALKAAGVVDAGDAMKLLDMKDLKLGENGEVEGIEALISSAKTAKPYLFKSATTSHSGEPPRPGDPKAKLARELNDADYETELAALLRR